jgi:hypothetical protein
MKKKFQIFISSTFTDLKEERLAVAQNVLELNHIPVGMEFFGASDQQQLDFIKAEIDQSDYYVLILGGRYGSIDRATGKSFTHLEYEYAVSKNVPVLVFLRSNRKELPILLRDADGSSIQLLDSFIEEASGQKRIRAEWSSVGELVLQSANALAKEINRTSASAVGWVRADSLTSSRDHQEIASLRSKISDLESRGDAFAADLTDPQSIYDSIDQIVDSLDDKEITGREKNDLRRLAASRLNDLIGLGLNGEVSPNLLFNAQVSAARLDMDTHALKLATVCDSLQASFSNKLAVLSRRTTVAASFEVLTQGQSRILKRTDKNPVEIVNDSLNEALLLAANAPAPQCEILFSQVWNISHRLRENLGVEKMLYVLMRSKCARQGVSPPPWLSQSEYEIPILDHFDWDSQKGQAVPSYMVGKIADCIAFLSPQNWRSEFIQFAEEAIEIHSKESPMVTWSQHFVRELVKTSHRLNLTKEIQEKFKEVGMLSHS